MTTVRTNTNSWLSRHSAFTLVELLVVIGIITVLIGILLPALSRARAQANAVKCMANLRSMAQAMVSYTADNRGWIPGNAVTTCGGFYKWNPAGFWTVVTKDPSAIPAGAPIELWDFVTPLSQVMKLKLRQADNPDALARWTEQLSLPQFQCPAAEGFTAAPAPASYYQYSPPSQYLAGPALPMSSYVTAQAFMLNSSTIVALRFDNVTSASRNLGYPALPAGYTPKLSKIKNSSQKIFAADGAKNTFNGLGPVYSLDPIPHNTEYDGNAGKYTDWGPWISMTSSYPQFPTTYLSGIGGGGASGAYDKRPLAYRHGSPSKGRPAGAYRMNAVFYDSHVETVDDAEATHPKHWLPTGSVLTDLRYSDPSVVARWNLKAPYFVP